MFRSVDWVHHEPVRPEGEEPGNYKALEEQDKGGDRHGLQRKPDKLDTISAMRKMGRFFSFDPRLRHSAARML